MPAGGWAAEAGATAALRSAAGPQRHLLRCVRRGCAWRLLPHDLPPWRLCYDSFAEWRESGLWQEINDHLRAAVREKSAKKKTPALRSSTRRVLKWLTTPECEAMMQEKRSEGEPSGARQTGRRPAPEGAAAAAINTASGGRHPRPDFGCRRDRGRCLGSCGSHGSAPAGAARPAATRATLGRRRLRGRHARRATA